mmetsp:Transcript_9912/g.28375  ORF Transcript_9912/g.28375 Transcript_9912/m.28375 type:complete len:259 (+) Transcript_9912:2164-2940(+)
MIARLSLLLCSFLPQVVFHAACHRQGPVRHHCCHGLGFAAAQQANALYALREQHLHGAERRGHHALSQWRKPELPAVHHGGCAEHTNTVMQFEGNRVELPACREGSQEASLLSVPLDVQSLCKGEGHLVLEVPLPVAAPPNLQAQAPPTAAAEAHCHRQELRVRAPLKAEALSRSGRWRLSAVLGEVKAAVLKAVALKEDHPRPGACLAHTVEVAAVGLPVDGEAKAVQPVGARHNLARVAPQHCHPALPVRAAEVGC